MLCQSEKGCGIVRDRKPLTFFYFRLWEAHIARGRSPHNLQVTLTGTMIQKYTTESLAKSDLH